VLGCCVCVIALLEIEREIAFDRRKRISGISRLLSASTEENVIDIAVGGVRVAVSQEIRFFQWMPPDFTVQLAASVESRNGNDRVRVVA
jgi:hypothetical protein